MAKPSDRVDAYAASLLQAVYTNEQLRRAMADEAAKKGVPDRQYIASWCWAVAEEFANTKPGTVEAIDVAVASIETIETVAGGDTALPAEETAAPDTSNP